ncbi:transketolase [Hutsoniella sourekii]|uniref:transketolase n=1 Tax=Hutsoniella sourekii TaxID=87650 RepID=UPI000484C56A|nr:transketolase [Hutsoniella sourekii]
MFTKTGQLAVNAIRALSVDQIEKANSGHPGLPMGAAPMAYALWADHLQVDPKASDWINRDRFVLSAGHGSALLYSLLHLAGFDVTIEDLKNFRQLASRTPGHPEYRHTDGVEATTGPLGQGIAQAVGMAMAEAHQAALYNTDDHAIIDHFTYTLCGDGDLMEGVAYEALSYAGRQELEKLIVLYDSNDISLDGDLDQAFTEDIKGRFEAINWHYLRVEDGNDLEAISQAIQEAKDHKGQPTIIEIKTVIGYGAPKQGTNAVHGAPIGADDWSVAKEAYGWTSEAFEVPEEAYQAFKERVQERGQKAHQAWQATYDAYKEANPEQAAELEAAYAGELPEGFDQGLTYQEAGAGEASRASSGAAIQALSKEIPFFWGGSADLSGSNNTMVKAEEDFMPESRQGRNIWFGVREFAMAAMMNGIALHGGSKIYGGTFFVFTDYLKGAVRLSALSGLPVIYVMTHDSIAVGEDGPTHEPIEQLAAFRAMPNLNVIRPADVNETYAAWKVALKEADRPTMLVLSRQGLPTLEATQSLAEEGVDKGGYVLSPAKGETPEGILIATGSEVNLAIETQAQLAQDGIDVSVVSLPAMNRFDEQSEDYKESVLPKAVKNRVSIEMAATFGWERYVGLEGITLGIDRFGASGPGNQVIERFGFTTDKVAQAYKDAFK